MLVVLFLTIATAAFAVLMPWIKRSRPTRNPDRFGLRHLAATLLAIWGSICPAEAADTLVQNFTVGKSITASYFSVYNAGAGIIYENGISGSIPGTTFNVFDYNNTIYLRVLGTPTTIGQYPITLNYRYYEYINECDEFDPTFCWPSSRVVYKSADFVANVIPATLTVTPATLDTLTVNQPVNITFSTTGGTDPYTYSISAGALPSGLTLSHDGLISGTPSAVQPYSFTVQITDAYGSATDKIYSGSVMRPTPAVAVTSSNTSPSFGTSITLTATLSGGVSPSGTVTFKDGATTLGTGTISGSTATFTTSALAVGSHSITAVYGGDGDNQSAISSAVTVAVAQAAPSVSLVSSSANPVFGTSVTFTATLSGGAAPSGTVTFKDGATTLGTATISGSAATFATSTLTVGSHSITAVYGGDSSNQAATSTAVTVAVAQTAPSVSLVSSSANPVFGTSVTFTATLSGGSDPSGTVTFKDGATTLGTATISGSAATFATSTLTVGSHSITAVYGGDSGNQAATSSAVTVAVAQTAPSVSLVSSSANPVFGTSVTFTATLSGGTAPSGTVTFKDGATTLGTATISGSTATFSTSTLTAGSHSITAVYGGDSSNQAATSTAATVAVSLPILSLSPAGGALAAGTAGVSYSQILSAGNGTAPYTFDVTSGTLPPGLTLSTAGTLSGEPSSEGDYGFTVTAVDANGATGNQTYSVAIAIAAPVAGNVSATVPANSTSNSIALILSGGSASRIDVVSGPSHGTATISGTSILFTPSAGYSGSDAFTYTATNASGTSATATVSITISAPSLVLSPSAGVLPNGTVGTVYSQAFSASDGAAPYRYAVTTGALPQGLTLSPTTGLVSGTPTSAGSANFSITATDAHNAVGMAAYTIAIAIQAPTAGNANATVAANSSANPVTLSLSGGAAASVTVVSPPAHGTASPSGTTITYTPVAGYSGRDSFTYTATNISGTSAPATVNVTVAPPTLVFSPAAGALSDGTVGHIYNQALFASGGTAPYAYAITAGALPAGLSLNTASGALSGTPTAAGTTNFSITATDANNATSVVTYALKIAAPAANFAFTPSSGPLSEAMAGEDYSQSLAATGGTGMLLYSLASGTLPDGIVLNASTGELTGPLSANSEGDYSFAIAVRDANGSTGSARYTLKVAPRVVTVTDRVVNVPEGGTPPDVYLNRGATGGPFTSADLTFVEPANAGTAQVTQGQLAAAGASITPVGWYLQFTPNPAYSGQVRIGYRLNSALGTSNTGTITYNLTYAPADVADEIDTLVHDFVKTRQNLIASSIKVPGLLERRQMGQASDPVTTRISPTEDGLTLGFSTSLAQLEAARNGTGAYLPAFNLWIDAAFLAHNDKDINGGKWGSFAMLSMGADYLISDKALIGLSFHYDRMTDPTDQDAELMGNGWLAGPYASVEIARNLFWNASLLYGGSANTIDTTFWDGGFDTRRFLADTSLTGQWALDADTTITPKIRAVYFSEKVEDYTVRNSAGDALTIDGFDEKQFRLSLGAEIARSFTLANGAKLTPKLGVTGGYSGLDGSGAFGSVTAGLSLQTMDLWMLDASLLFNIENEGAMSVGARVAASRRF